MHRVLTLEQTSEPAGKRGTGGSRMLVKCTSDIDCPHQHIRNKGTHQITRTATFVAALNGYVISVCSQLQNDEQRQLYVENWTLPKHRKLDFWTFSKHRKVQTVQPYTQQ